MILKTGLVLEGGGMRGVFTSGVTDCFLDNHIEFPYIAAVSAGASNGLSYASKQRGRSRFCNIDALEKYRYIGLKYLITQRCIMDYKFMFGDLPTKVYPYDFNTYLNAGRFILTTTNCLTGEANYIEKPRTSEQLLTVCRASCSMPFVCPIVNVDGVPMLDGGIADAIPIGKAISDGYKKNVVVLTRNKGYRKPIEFQHLPFFVYSKYPKLREALKRKSYIYNDTITFIEELEERGEIVVIRPQEEIKISRLARDTSALQALYEEGYKCAQLAIEKIKNLNENAQ